MPTSRYPNKCTHAHTRDPTGQQCTIESQEKYFVTIAGLLSSEQRYDRYPAFDTERKCSHHAGGRAQRHKIFTGDLKPAVGTIVHGTTVYIYITAWHAKRPRACVRLALDKMRQQIRTPEQNEPCIKMWARRILLHFL
jgi:hypothetical protein